MKRFVSMFAVCAIAGLLAAGCTKSSSSDQNANATTAPAGGAMAAGDATHGKAIFTQNCSSCHGPDGTQGGIGPSLKNEKSRKDTAAAIAWIKDPKPPMPKLYPSPLSEKDVEDVAAYVESL